MSLSKSALYYRNNPEARAKKDAYNKEFQKNPEQVRKRVQCNRFNRKNGTYGNRDKIDCSHQKNGNLIREHQKANRARGGALRR